MSTDIKIPPFEHTPLDDIPQAVAELHQFFRTNQSKDVEWRLVQLRKLWWGLQDFTPKIQAALKQDLNKSAHDATFSEIAFNDQDLTFIIKHLKSWAKDEKAEYPITFAPLKPRIRKEPLGPVLIIGTYNFPFMLNFGPLIGAIAAGCPALVKPSENAPATAVVFKELVETYLDRSAYKVVLGAVPETTVLLEQRWGKIMYTGNTTVARIVLRKAAENLTPVALELGGKNPAFITRATDLALAARRLMWGKTIAAGQVCMSHNYVLVERSLVDGFIKHVNAVSKDFFPEGPLNCQDYCRVINERQFDRMKNMLDTTSGKIVLGGETDRDRLLIAPTAVLVDSSDDIMVREESFGPIWAILPYDNLDDAIKVANDVDSTPLSLMAFGSDSENQKILTHVTSGGATLNDSFMHGAIATLPFGGVGESGTGAYHSRAGFDCFSHRRTVVENPGWMDRFLRVRYFPYTAASMREYEWLSRTRPDFDRDGRPVKGVRYWLGLVLGLGRAGGAKGALLRWAVVLVSGYAAVSTGLVDRGLVVDRLRDVLATAKVALP